MFGRARITLPGMAFDFIPNRRFKDPPYFLSVVGTIRDLYRQKVYLDDTCQ
jgi:hypothetical protein